MSTPKINHIDQKETTELKYFSRSNRLELFTKS